MSAWILNNAKIGGTGSFFTLTQRHVLWKTVPFGLFIIRANERQKASASTPTAQGTRFCPPFACNLSPRPFSLLMLCEAVVDLVGQVSVEVGQRLLDADIASCTA